MLKKTLAIVLVILTLFISSACTYFENTISVSSDTEGEAVESESLSSESDVITSDLIEDTTDTADSPADTGEISSNEPVKGPAEEIDIKDFVGLDWKFEEGDKYPSLTKDEILALDKNSYYIGAAPEYAYNGKYFRVFIGSDNRSLFGCDGFLHYSAKFKCDGPNENVVEESSGIYNYKYVGDGSEVPFESDMVFTIPNVTYNEYLDILNKAAEFTKQDVNDIKLIYDHKYTKIAEIPEILNVDNYDDVVNVDTFEISTNSMSIPDCKDYPFYIKIDWLSEKRFNHVNREHIEIYPDEETIYNRVVIRVYWSESQAYTTEADQSGKHAETSDLNITGKFLSSKKHSSLAVTPSISFSGDGLCILFFNYYQGCCEMQGKYRIDGNKIYVDLNFDNTIFEDSGNEYRDLDYMSDNYIFTIVSDNELIINRGCYTVNANDYFERVSVEKTEPLNIGIETDDRE